MGVLCISSTHVLNNVQRARKKRAKTCKNVQKRASQVLIYQKTCKNMQKHAKTCKNVQKRAKTCKNVHLKYSFIKKPCKNVQQHAKTCKNVHLKYFWTQFKNVHLQGPCSLRPCISRPYCTFKPCWSRLLRPPRPGGRLYPPQYYGPCLA